VTKRSEHSPLRSDPYITEIFGDPISVYTREEALADGVLIDVSQWAGSGPDGMLGGFVVPVVITQALWAVIDVDEGAGDTTSWRARARRGGESTRGRAHDVLWLASVAVRRSAESDRVQFGVLMTQDEPAGRVRRHRLALEARIDAEGIVIGFPEDF
jgi:hypothetical protein